MSTEESLPPPPKARPVIDHLPVDWRPTAGEGLAVAYTMLGVPKAALIPPFAVVLGDVCVIVGWMALPILGVQSVLRQDDDGQIKVDVRTGDDTLREACATSIFIASLGDDDQGLDDARNRVHAAVGLLSAIGTKLLAFEHVEDYRVSFADGTFQSTSRLVANMLWWLTPDLSENARDVWHRAANALSDSPERERIELSLRWYDEAKRESGVDSFLKLWFALETLAMPDTTDIAPIRNALSLAYPDCGDVEKEFGIGRTFGLRGRIVHDGVRVEISNRLLTLLGGIYLDLLAMALDFDSPGRTRVAISDAGGALNALPAIVGGRSELADAEHAEDQMERLRKERPKDADT